MELQQRYQTLKEDSNGNVENEKHQKRASDGLSGRPGLAEQSCTQVNRNDHNAEKDSKKKSNSIHDMSFSIRYFTREI